MVNYILSKSPNGLFLIFERSVQFDFTIRLSKNNFSITKFSKENNISRSYLNKMFLENTGITPTNYLLRLRMEKAKVAISSTSKLVKEIAKEVGYTDEYTFSKAFKRYTGLSPIYYRESSHMN